MKEFFSIGSKLSISLPASCINDTVKEIVYGFFYRSVDISYVPCDDLCIKIGEASPVELKSGEGVISVTEKGVFVTAINERALLNCLFLVLEKLVPENLSVGEEKMILPVGTEVVSPSISRRMIHFCIFPRISLHVYKKLFRLAAVLGYTHIVVEFWGTFPYECMQELAWKNEAFTKQEVAELLREASDLKVELIPMINHFGHASSARMRNGKHVVLDQNPRRATLFSPDGWRWNFERKEVLELLRAMRHELFEIFGSGRYFHIGFDESFSYPWNDASVESLCGYLKQLCAEVLAEGRIPMLWGDQLLHEQTLGIGLETGYEGNAPTSEIAGKILSALPREAIVCDWQYFVKTAPWRSAQYFKENAVNFMVCPWSDADGLATAIETAKIYACYGVLHTTWDKLFKEKGVNALFLARDTFFGKGQATEKVGNRLENAALMRKICFADGNYEAAGWARQDVINVFSE